MPTNKPVGLLGKRPGAGLLGGLDWSTLGPMLMALGGGIAGGATQGWGAGIGQGLQLAGQARENLQDRRLRDETLKALTDYREAGLGLRERELASADAYRNARIADMQNPGTKIGATVEGIRAKLARGETLTPGENQVYQDMLKQDFVTRLLQGQGQLGMPPSQAPIPQSGSATAPVPRSVKTVPVGPASTSSGPKPFEPDQARRQIGQVYNLPNGKQALWTQDAQGAVGWEPLN